MEQGANGEYGVQAGSVGEGWREGSAAAVVSENNQKMKKLAEQT